jgi:hypothetical protein
MKKSVYVSMILVLVGASAAHAGSGVSYSANECSDAQWKQALSKYSPITPSAQVWFDGVALDATDLCIDGGSLRPKTGAAFSVPTAGDGEEETTRTVNWLKPLKGTEAVCEYKDGNYEEGCEWKSEYKEFSTTVQIPVIDLDSENRDEVCTKTYTIPACN